MNDLTRKLLAAAFLASCAPACGTDSAGPEGDHANDASVSEPRPGDEGRPDGDEANDSDSSDDGRDNGDSSDNGDNGDNGRGDHPRDNADPRDGDDDPRDNADDPRDGDDDPWGDDDPRDGDDDPRSNNGGDDDPPHVDVPPPSVDSTVEVDRDRHGRDCLSLTNPHGDGLEICGEWHWDAERDLFTADGDMALMTPLGEIPLLDARLRASDSPVLLHGEANVGLPGLGFLEAMGGEGSAPRAEIQLAHGRDLEAIEINGQELEPNPDHFYVYFDYNVGVGAEFGPFSVSSPGSASTMVIAPEEPFVYLGGDLAGMLTGGVIDDAAIGFSLAGRMPYSTENELYDGDDWFQPELQGHFFAQGSVQLGSYPISIAARAFVDADANNDGETAFEGDPRDFILAADGSVSLGYSKAGFDLSVEAGSGSVLYDASTGRIGTLYFYGEAGIGNFLEDTALDFIELRGQQTSMYGMFADLDDFVVGMNYQSASMVGFTITEVGFELREEGITMDGAIAPPVLNLVGDNEVSMHGELEQDGTFALTGRANAEILGLQLANANLTLTNNGLGLDGRVDIPRMGHANLNGAIEADGSFELNGDAELTPFGLTLADARLRMSDELRGAYVTARFDARVAQIDLSGTLTADTIDLQGRTQVRIPVRVDQEVAQWVTDAAICGTERITDAARCGTEFIVNGARCGYDVVRDAAACGTSVVRDAAICGTRLVRDGAVCGFDTVTNAAQCGTRTVCDEVLGWFGLEEICESVARTCDVPRSCRIANECEIANECRVEARCEVPRSCDIPATCEQRVVVPDVDLGAFEGELSMRIGNQGAGGSVDGRYCVTPNDCVPLAGGRVDLSGDPEVCVTVPAAGEVCAPL